MLSAEGFRHVGALKTLRVLRAYGGPGGAEGLPFVAVLPDLETLILDHTGVTDASLESLSGARRLRRLEVREPKVTEDGLAKLRGARPTLEIVR
jgi:hypothetical protein